MSDDLAALRALVSSAKQLVAVGHVSQSSELAANIVRADAALARLASPPVPVAPATAGPVPTGSGASQRTARDSQEVGPGDPPPAPPADVRWPSEEEVAVAAVNAFDLGATTTVESFRRWNEWDRDLELKRARAVLALFRPVLAAALTAERQAGEKWAAEMERSALYQQEQRTLQYERAESAEARVAALTQALWHLVEYVKDCSIRAPDVDASPMRAARELLAAPPGAAEPGAGG